MNWFWKIVILLFVAALAYLGMQEWLYKRALEEKGGGETQVLFLIEKGTSVTQIARDLETEGLVGDSSALTRYLEESDLDGQVKAGRFVLTRNLTIPELAERLTADESEQLRVRIPEGFTLAQADAYLAERLIIPEGELVKCASEGDFSDLWIVAGEPAEVKQRLEGYLFPDTYFQDVREVSACGVVERALVEMQRKMTPDVQAQLEKEGRTIHEAMTIASLVEKETWTEEEKPIVAGILWARIDEGMRLDVDATTRYAVGKLRETLTKDDLGSDDPYNSRKKWGMIPGPIGTFSQASWEAAVWPTETAYRYYLHDAEGQVHYAETLAGHNRNVAEWL